MAIPRHRWTISLVALLLYMPSPATAFDSDHAAALLTFPYVEVDQTQGVDTRLRLSNTDTAAAVHVNCGLENTTARCLSSQEVCRDDSDCGDADPCVQGLGVSRFAFQLAAGQPVTWLLSTGGKLPLPENGGPIPAAPENPMRGILRCVATNPDGSPSARNVLQGEATIERATSATLDVAIYNAVGQRAHADAVDDDGVLVVGGPAAEFDGCPAIVGVNHTLDLAVDPIAIGRDLQTTLALAACGGDLSRAAPTEPARRVMQLTLRNEFGQRFSTSTVFETQLVTPLSLIDTTDPTRSIFSAGVVGTLTASTRIESFGGGVMGIGLEKRRSLADPEDFTTAAFNLHSTGERAEADQIVLGLRCPAQPVANCRTAHFNRLTLSDRSQRRVAWEWRRGDLPNTSQLGDPRSDAALALCLYIGGQPAAQFIVPPAAPAWSARRSGLTYLDRAASNAGIRTIVIEPSASTRARVALRAAGSAVPPFDLTAGAATPVTVQLLNDRTGVCLESVFDGSDVIRNRAHLFDARSVVGP